MSKKKALVNLTLESLGTSDAAIAQAWRAIRAEPGLTEAQIAQRIQYFSGVNPMLRRLISDKWACRSGSGTLTDPYRYSGLESTEPPKRHIGERLNEIRRDLTRIAKKAHDARYTGLAGKMGTALSEVEKEIVEVREQLYVRR